MVLGHLKALVTALTTRAKQAVLRHRVRARHPTLHTHHTAIWDYAFGDLDRMEIGKSVSVGAFTEIIFYRHSPHSSVPGELVLKDGAIISTGCNIRAAGGRIELGRNSAFAQNTVVVASNHAVGDDDRLRTGWDETRTGVIVGDNVWVGANCVILAGTRIGQGAVIAAGAVVNGDVPAGELWGGVPARRIKSLDEGAGAPASQVR